MRSVALRRPAWLFPGFLLRWPCPSPRVWAVRWFSGVFPPCRASSLLSHLRLPPCVLGDADSCCSGFGLAVQSWISPHNGKRDMPCTLIGHYSVGSVAGRATYLAVHLELGCGHHRTAGRPWRVGPRGCWRAALVVVTAGWHHRVPGSTMAPMWPLAGTAACRGLAEVARGDGLAHGDLRPGGSRLACKWRGRIGFAQEASAAASPRWRASFVPSC